MQSRDDFFSSLHQKRLFFCGLQTSLVKCKYVNVHLANFNERFYDDAVLINTII